ncbi:MAG: oligosaccharide flippase family protein [Bacteroidota bacterium]|jgi:O-antigen/teichoic acid export membrane protein
MQKKVLSSIGLVFVVNILIKPLWILVIDRGVQNTLGYEAYGEYAGMFSISIILTMLLDFGINNYNSSTIANNPESVTKQFSELVPLKILLSLLYLIATLVLAIVFGYDWSFLFLIAALALNQILAHFSTFLRSSVSGLQLFKTDALLSAVDRLLMIALGVAMLWFNWFSVSIPHFIYIQTAGYAGVCLIVWFIVQPRLKHTKLTFNPALLKQLLQKTLPYALLAFIMLLYSRTDVLLIKKMLTDGNYQNGVYASGGRLLEAVVMMVGAVSTVLLPVFARMFARNESVQPVITMLVVLLLVPATALASVCSAYSWDILRLVSPDTDEYTSHVFSVLILSFIPYTAMYIFGSLLTAKGKLRTLIQICATALVFNIIVNVYSIPVWGAWGAAIAALITQTTVGFGKLTFSKIHIPDSLTPKILVYIGTHIVISISGAFGLKYMDVPVIVALPVLLVWAVVFTASMNIYSLRTLVAEARGLIKM